MIYIIRSPIFSKLLISCFNARNSSLCEVKKVNSFYKNLREDSNLKRNSFKAYLKKNSI